MTTALRNICFICALCIHMCHKMVYHCLLLPILMFQAAKYGLVNVDLRVATAKKLEVFGVYLDNSRRSPVCLVEWS